MKWLWRKIKKCLGIKKKYESHGEAGEPQAFKWGIIIPHTKKASGASSDKYNHNEYTYGMVMAEYSKFPYETRDLGGVKGAAARLRKRKVNASLEPHKNAYNGKAKGFECLVLEGDQLSYDYAAEIAMQFKRTFPTRVLRQSGTGVKVIKKGDRGYWNLAAAKAQGMEIALLSEAFFIDNDSEWIPPMEMTKFWREVLV